MVPRKPNPSPSTSMPSIKLDLGRYVTLRPRADGTYRVFFQVPARLRPSGWPSLIPLPITADRNGNLGDLVEVEAIRQDAKTLYRQLNGERIGREKREKKNFETLIRRYQLSDSWAALKPITQDGYVTSLNHIKRWVASTRPTEPDPCTITRAHVEDFLKLFNEVKDPTSGEVVHAATQTTKRHARKVLRLLMEEAISLGWRKDNPCDGIRLKGVKAKSLIWEQADVDAYVEAALNDGHHGAMKSIATIILLEWEIGQRLTDVRNFKPGVEYDLAQGVFRFWQSKTDQYVTIPVSARLRELLAEVAGNQMFLFRNERTGKAYTQHSLAKAFAWIRTAAVKARARPLLLRWLRHSCVVQLARAGCTVPEVAAITGHSAAGVSRILAVYLPRDNEVAWNAQRKRGLIDAG